MVFCKIYSKWRDRLFDIIKKQLGTPSCFLKNYMRNNEWEVIFYFGFSRRRFTIVFFMMVLICHHLLFLTWSTLRNRMAWYFFSRSKGRHGSHSSLVGWGVRSFFMASACAVCCAIWSLLIFSTCMFIILSFWFPRNKIAWTSGFVHRRVVKEFSIVPSVILSFPLPTCNIFYCPFSCPVLGYCAFLYFDCCLRISV